MQLYNKITMVYIVEQILTELNVISCCFVPMRNSVSHSNKKIEICGFS
jgi:hypothetical protein